LKQKIKMTIQNLFNTYDFLQFGLDISTIIYNYIYIILINNINLIGIILLILFFIFFSGRAGRALDVVWKSTTIVAGASIAPRNFFGDSNSNNNKDDNKDEKKYEKDDKDIKDIKDNKDNKDESKNNN